MRTPSCLAVWTGTEWECAACGYTTPYDLYAQHHGMSSMDLFLDEVEAAD